MSSSQTLDRPDADDAGRPPASSRRVTPSALVVGIGIAFAIVVAASGIAATVLQWHDDAAVQREVFVDIPSAWRLVFYTVLPVMLVYGAVLFSPAGQELGAGRARRPGAPPPKNVKRRLERLPRRRLHADAAARPRRRPHALADLLRLPGAARRHHGARDRPPDARGASSSSTATCTRPTPSSATSAGVRCSSSASSGRSCAATSSGPTASASSPSPSTPSSSARSSTIGVTGFAAEMFRIALEGEPDLREVVVRRLPAVDAGRRQQPPRPAGTRACGSRTSSASSCSW